MVPSRKSDITYYQVKIIPLLKHYAMRKYGEVEVNLKVFVTSALDRDKCSASPQGKGPSYPLDRRLDGSQSWTYHISHYMKNYYAS
jgi:hypothetical protein